MRSHRLRPTLEELRIYRQTVDYLETEPNLGLAEIAAKIECSPTTLHKCLQSLEHQYGGTLIERAERESQKTITPAGFGLYRLATQFLAQHQELAEWKAPGLDWLRVGVTQTVLNNVLVKVIPTFFGKIGTKARKGLRLRFIEDDHPGLVKAVATERADLAFGPHLKATPDRRVRIQRINSPIDYVMICHPEHAFAQRRATEISPRDLRTQTVLVLPNNVQPGLFQRVKVDEDAGGERIEVMSYASVLSFVRMGLGVGLVPGWYDELENLRGQVYYAPIPKLSPIYMSAYLPSPKSPSDDSPQLKPYAKELLACMEDHVRSLPKPDPR